MITIDELKVQLADYAKAVKDLEEALAIEASRKRVQELEHTMSRPGFYAVSYTHLTLLTTPYV